MDHNFLIMLKIIFNFQEKKILSRSFKVTQGHKFRKIVEKDQISIFVQIIQIKPQNDDFAMNFLKMLLRLFWATQGQKTEQGRKRSKFDFYQK